MLGITVAPMTMTHTHTHTKRERERDRTSLARRAAFEKLVENMVVALSL
jgi:hypothetical protein